MFKQLLVSGSEMTHFRNVVLNLKSMHFVGPLQMGLCMLIYSQIMLEYNRFFSEKKKAKQNKNKNDRKNANKVKENKLKDVINILKFFAPLICNT